MVQPLGPNQTKWLEALESSKYEQGLSRLRTIGNKFCCLGVACDIFGKEAGLSEWKIDDHHTQWYSIADSSEEAFGGRLPQSMIQFMGFRDSLGINIDQNNKKALALLNDSGKSFGEIAAIIRQDPSVYFTEPL